MENLNHLRQLLALAETGNYRKAGERLGMSHSAVSQTIAKLEGLFEVTLFEKSGGETVPTAFGLRVVDSSKTMLMELERATRDLESLEDHRGGELVIGADPALCESLISPAIARTIEQRPNLKFKVNVTAPGKEIKKLRDRQIDLYIGLKPDEVVADLKYTDIKLKPPIVLCRRDHPLKNSNTITVTDMEPFPCISGEFPEWIKTEFNNRHVSAGGKFDKFRTLFLISQSHTLVRQVLMYGENTLAVLPKEIVKRELKSGQLKELKLDPPVFPGLVDGVIAFNQEYPITPAAKLIAKIIQEMTADLTQHSEGKN